MGIVDNINSAIIGIDDSLSEAITKVNKMDKPSACELVVDINEDYTNIYKMANIDQNNIIGNAMSNSQCLATFISKDKKFYYLPAYKGWVSVMNVTIVNRSDTDVMIKALKATDGKAIITDHGVSDYISEKNKRDNELAKTTITNTGFGGSDFNVGTDGVFGIPYQFSERVDIRLSGSERTKNKTGLGNIYAEKILSRSNFLYLTPGTQVFMDGASDAEKEGILANLANGIIGDGIIDSNKIVNSSCKYYTLKFDTYNYFKYVDPMCSTVAKLLGIEDTPYKGTTLGNMSWASNIDSNFADIWSARNNIVYYVDGFNEVSDDFSNDTRESSIMSSINGVSDSVKELNYVLGYHNISDVGALDNPQYESAKSSIADTIKQFTKGHGVLDAVMGNANTVLSGGKLVFPELWSDSSYDRSYNINIKLRSPDNDPVSIFLNLIVPYIHLLAMTAPRDFDGAHNSNGYVAPFLVRAFFRGGFNIDLGIITGLSCSRGGEGMWSLDCLPTSMDISLTIKDLYKSMYISQNNSILKFVSNDAQMDYLMNLSGVMTNDESIKRRVSIYTTLLGNKFFSTPQRIGNKFRQYIDNSSLRFYGNYGS